MAKRFIDTKIFDDSWFMELSLESKLLWIYLITKCNHAGIIEYNKKLWEFHTGLNSLETVIKELTNRLVSVNDSKYYFIPKFITYQYPNFPNSKVRAQDSAIKILIGFGLFDEQNLTVNKPLDKCYDNDNGFVYGSGYVNVNSLKVKYLKNEKLVDIILNKNKDVPYKTVEQLTKGLDEFNLHLQSSGKMVSDWNGYSNHFLNWSRKKKDIKKNVTPFDNMAF